MQNEKKALVLYHHHQKKLLLQQLLLVLRGTSRCGSDACVGAVVTAIATSSASTSIQGRNVLSVGSHTRSIGTAANARLNAAGSAWGKGSSDA